MPDSHTQPFSGIFVSYRRDDSSGHAGRLFDKLVSHFGSDRIFMDIDTIEPGEDFITVIENAVGSCEILIAIIGRNWLSGAAGATGRLNDPNDFVRVEIATALRRDIRVIPVLVQRASMPKQDDLPGDLAKLARRNAIELNDVRWQNDVEQLIDVMERVLAKRKEAAQLDRQAEAERQRQAEEEKRIAEEVTRRAAEEQRAEEEKRLREEEVERVRLAEEAKRRAEEERQIRLAEEEAKQRAAEVQRRKAERERRAEEERTRLASLEAAEQSLKRRAEEEDRTRAETEQRLRAEQDARRGVLSSATLKVGDSAKPDSRKRSLIIAGGAALVILSAIGLWLALGSMRQNSSSGSEAGSIEQSGAPANNSGSTVPSLNPPANANTETTSPASENSAEASAGTKPSSSPTPGRKVTRDPGAAERQKRALDALK